MSRSDNTSGLAIGPGPFMIADMVFSTDICLSSCEECGLPSR
jgi:hypothetical protein